MSTPTVSEFKAQAKAVRAVCAERGIALSHSASLEALAKQYGFRDWNAARAQAPLSRDDESVSPFSSTKMLRLLVGDVDGLPNTRRFDPEAALKDLSQSIDELSKSRTWMTPEEGERILRNLSERAIALKGLPDWKRSDPYETWLMDADDFLADIMDWADDGLAVALATMATLTYRLPFHLSRMPNLHYFWAKYERWLRDTSKSRAAVEQHFPGHTKAWAEADAKARAEVERVLNDPSLTDEEAEAGGASRNHEITRMEEKLERIQAAALDAQERGETEEYENLMAEHIELAGRIEKAHADDEYEEE